MKSKHSHSKRAEKTPPYLKPLRTFADSLAELADEVASLDSLTDKEKETLRECRDQLNSSVDDLINILAAHDALQMGRCGPEWRIADWDKPFNPSGALLLRVALSQAYTIGSYAVYSPIKTRLDREEKRASAAYATQQLSARTKVTDDLIASMIKFVLEKHPHLNRGKDSEVARAILKPLNEKLKALEQSKVLTKPKTLAYNTIRKKLKDIRRQPFGSLA